MRFLAQPWEGVGARVGDHILRLFAEEPRFDVVRILVAYAKTSGVLRLGKAMREFRERGGRVEVVVGVDDAVTSRQALQLLMEFASVTYVYHNPVTIFHPKVYLFARLLGPEPRATAIVGSSNLTGGGLFTNYETSILLDFDLQAREGRSDYLQVRKLFGRVVNERAGNIRLLTSVLIDDLVSQRMVGDEQRSRRTARGQPPRDRGGAGLFPRSAVPPPPRIDATLRHMIPARLAPIPVEEADEPESITEGGQTFAMILGPRDVAGNRSGFSPDVFIPLAARDAEPGFWGWPQAFAPHPVKGERYLERRLNILLQAAGRSPWVASDIRLYFYETKHEFRLNSSELIEGARPDDILVLRKTVGEETWQGEPYEFEAVIVPRDHASYSAFFTSCTTAVGGASSKRWGYVEEARSTG